MTCDDDVRLLLGAYILGGLSDEDHRTFAAHLRTCPHCQVEAAQLSGLPRLLDLVDDPLEAAQPGQSLSDPGPEPGAVLLAEVRRERRRRRIRLLAAACVLGLAMLGIGWYVGARIATPTRPPTTQLSAVAEPGSSAQVEFGLVSRQWGTQLEVAATSLPTQGQLGLWIVDASGQAVRVATWNAIPAGRATLTAACATPTAEIRVVQVRLDTGQALATATT
jgi:anti-sigma factor RsiW